ncbi:uncharacterized protein LOC123548162 [Mercenaria mercenaria]|uniref:uncharacterized protein LOC123548162 n=1 Tax=Mercenaria mercenaria TaxID=6596 RepID=UPI00234E789E|nr:uncharacterized protein LOC123548162 [Mercenaria mercenaria]
MSMVYSKEILNIVLVCFVGYAVSAGTTRGTTVYHEPSIQHNIRFTYDAVLHNLIATTTGTCFMVPLNHDELDHVHTTRGIEDLEIKMVREWIGQLPETRIYHGDPHLPGDTRKLCNGKDIFLLQRDVDTSSPLSPLVTG